MVAPYLERDPRRAIGQVLTSVPPYGLCWWLMYESLELSYVLTLLLAIPASGFLVRAFIVLHDCAHGSFFASRRTNVWVGCGLGVLSCTPFHEWRRRHKLHHATSGNLARRGWWDIETLTTGEYRRLSVGRKLLYRLYRNPLFLFGVAPLVFFLVVQRFAGPGARARHHLSVMATNLVLAALMVAMTRWLGVAPFLKVQLPIFALAATAAFWLFYVQHQFEGSHWAEAGAWNFEHAALKGSSFYELPAVLRWFTGSIGYHHIHHLCPRIPNYRLRACHEANPKLRHVPTLTLWTSGRALRVRLWDEEAQRMVGFDSVGTLRFALIALERAWNAASRWLQLPRVADIADWLPLIGSFGGSVVARHPAVVDPALGRSTARVFTVTKIVVDDRRRLPAGVGCEVKKRLFAEDPMFLFNVFFACGSDGYSDPESIWFNVFYGGYEIDVPRSLWKRPFGYSEGPDRLPRADEILRLGRADWNYFSNHLAGVPLDALGNDVDIGGAPHPFRYVGRRRPGPTGTIEDDRRLWDEVEIDGVEVVTTHLSTRDGGRFRDSSRCFGPLWRWSFGVRGPKESEYPSFVPTTMRARLYLSWCEGRSSRYGDVFRTFVFGATVNGCFPDAANDRLFRLQLEALENLMRNHYPHLGFSGD